MTNKDITVILVDGGNNPLQSAKTVNHCAKLMDWGAVRLFTFQNPGIPVNGEVFIIPKLDFPIGRSKFMGELGPCLFATEFMLYVETDGYPINPHLWDNAWFDYDLVGPVWSTGFMKKVAGAWPSLHKPTIGSGGCSLRSRKMARKTADLAVEQNGIRAGLDFYDSIQYRAELERRGVKYAPADVGIRFCYQLPLDEFPGWTDAQSFSFHCIDRLGAPAGRKFIT